MKALYRKYRPTKLTDVVGQDQIVKSLADSLKNNKINHAYVFAGPRGTGKTSIARIFAHAVNDFDYQLEDDYLDIVEIDAASNNGVDNIRDLREKAIIAPTKGKYKVYIIDEAHMLTKSAANALLKLLEEPPAHVIFIMATTEIDKIPITILSRTQMYTFKLAEPEAMLRHLAKIAEAEKIKIDQGGLEVVVRRGGGSFRDSLSLLDQVATLTDEQITATVLEKALGVPSQEKITLLLDNYKTGDSEGIEREFKELLQSGLRAENIASEMLAKIISHPEAETLPLLKSLPEVAPPFADAKLLLALLEGKLNPSVQSSPVKKTVTEEPRSSNLAVTRVKSSGEQNHPSSDKIAVTGGKSAEEPVKPKDDPAPAVAIDASLNTTNVDNIVNGDVLPLDSDNFDWNGLIVKISEISTSTAKPLEKSKYEIKNGALQIYPENNFSAKILKSAKHSEIIRQALGNYSFTVHDANSGMIQPKDETVAKISAIMGNVQEIDGDMPF